MTAASSGGGGGGASSPSAPRAMKRELAFALQSLSEITASPGRTRSGRSISSPVLHSSPAPSPAAKRRKARSDPSGKDDEAPPPDLVSPTTPPLDSETPKVAAQGLPLDALVPTEVAGQDAALVLPEVACPDAAQATPLVAEVLPEVSRDTAEAPPLDPEVLPGVSHYTSEGPPLDAELLLPEVSHYTTEAPPLDAEVLPEVSHDTTEAPPLDEVALPEVSQDIAEGPPLYAEVLPKTLTLAAEVSPKASQDAAEVSTKASPDDTVMMDAEVQPNTQGDADLMGPCVFLLPTKEEEKVESKPALSPQRLKDGLPAPGEEAEFVSELPESDGNPAKQDPGVEPSAASSHAMPDTEEGAGMELNAPPALLESAPVTDEDHSDNKLMDACHVSNKPNVLDNVLSDPPVAEDAATPIFTAMAEEDAAAPASTAMALEDSAAPASTAMAAEHAATLASTAMSPEDSFTPASTALAAEDAITPASTAMAPEDPVTPASTAMAPEDATTSASTAKPKRRIKRSLLGLDRETAASEIIGDASIDLTATPGRRFTRSQLKTKVEACPSSSLVVVSEEPVDSTPETPPSVTKMEMKMSKKVACLSKRPGSIKDLLSTGLLEGMPVMYVPHNSKKSVLKGVITGCNIRCYCVKCDGSQAISTYLFESHAGSHKKHPAENIYLENGNSLRRVLCNCETSPLESLDKTIQFSIDPMLIKTHTNCANCNGQLPSPQAERFLCHHCWPDSKQPQDPTSPYACSKSNSSLSPSSKESLLNTMSASKCGSTGKVTTKDTGLHKLVFKVLLDGTEVSYYVDGQKKVDGYIKDQRIYCNHCNRVVSPSAFEAHAGEGSRRKPYDNIFLSNGVSLHELSLKLSRNMALSERETDDVCRECGAGGDIFPCKICPRSFHPACVGLPGVPSEWFCDNCTTLVQKEKALAANKNAKAAGRQAGVDSIEQIMKRAIRIVPICDDLGGCALCKKKDFNNAVFDERTVILCDQCEKEYHVGCLRSEWKVDLKELPEGEWFCCNSCSEIRSSLGKMISEGAQPLLESDLDIIKKKHESKGLIMDTNTDIRWQLVAGRSPTEDGNLLLSSAVPVIHQSFDPIIEANTGRDLIPEMVHGRRPKEGMPGQDYSGMYCAVLTVGSTVVSAALLRVMGGDVAELPLVATSMDLQGLGYFQVLFSCVERLLISLKVKHFMLPAAHEAEAIWMKKFGFSKVPQEQLEAYLNGAHLTVFHGTLNLYKAIPLP